MRVNGEMAAGAPQRSWVGVAGREHVRIGRDGGFCQLNHGKRQPLARLKPGDGLVYYSPREGIRNGRAVQAFTALGIIAEGEPYAFEMACGFRPFRRDVTYLETSDAAIRPLLDTLSFTTGRKSWGYAFRRGFFEITAGDFAVIAAAMRAGAR